MAARMVRPVKSTSSTRTTVRPLMGKGISVPRTTRLLGLEAQIVPVERDVERAHRRAFGPRWRRSWSAIRAARVTPRVLMPTRATSSHPAGLFDDLVGDAGQGPVQRGLVEDLRLLAQGYGHEKSPERGWRSAVVFA